MEGHRQVTMLRGVSKAKAKAPSTMLSGMDLLLRAAGRDGGGDASSADTTLETTVGTVCSDPVSASLPHPHKIAPSKEHRPQGSDLGSLPPKKRARRGPRLDLDLGPVGQDSGRVNPPTPAADGTGPLSFPRVATGPFASDGNNAPTDVVRTNVIPPLRRLTGPMAVKDANGNDLRMGYFSSSSSHPAQPHTYVVTSDASTTASEGGRDDGSRESIDLLARGARGPGSKSSAAATATVPAMAKSAAPAMAAATPAARRAGPPTVQDEVLRRARASLYAAYLAALGDLPRS